MIGLLSFMLAAVLIDVDTSSDPQRVEAFARFARAGQDLPYLAPAAVFQRFANKKMVVLGTLSNVWSDEPATQAEFGKAVKKCAVRKIDPSKMGFYVHLACPRDKLNADVAVAYEVTLTDHLISRVRFQIGVMVIPPAPPGMKSDL